MSLHLGERYPLHARFAAPASSSARPLRLGIINVMPRVEQYEPYLLDPLAQSTIHVEPIFIRLDSHVYRSSDPDHIAKHYRSYADAIDGGSLDGLLLTGAPVEELPFEEVRYWSELTQILHHARRVSTGVLGICWGGLALASLVGIPKRLHRSKLFGVYEHRVLVFDHPLLRSQARAFPCAHSRHAGVVDEELDRASDDGRIRLLAQSGTVGHTLFETTDHDFVMHLGHPEYDVDRIRFEWERDASRGRSDVTAPVGVDLDCSETTWRAHREGFFEAWLGLIAARRRALVDTGPGRVLDSVA